MPNRYAKEVPPFKEYFNPVIESLGAMGGAAPRSEIEDKVIELMNITEEQVSYTYDNSSKSIVLDRISWALSWLKRGGIVKQGSQSVYTLTDKNQKAINIPEYFKKYREIVAKEKEERNKYLDEEDADEVALEDIPEKTLEEILLDKIKELEPMAFEMLCKRLLEESGVMDVEVTSQSHDRGIDGTGILKVEGLVSMRIAFQAKRFTTAIVDSSIIRNFRGSLPANTDKGIVITTGKFTPSAKKEATDPEKPTIIDLIDGDDLIEKMKECSMGVKVEKVNSILEINDRYFEQFEK